MNLFFINTPKNPKILKVLQHVFTPEEAAMLANFSSPFLDAQTIEKFAKKTKIPLEKVEKIFEGLSRRGLIFKIHNKNDGLDYYSLMTMNPGIFDFYYAANPNGDPKKERPMAEFFEDYLIGTLTHEMRSTSPWVRVLPAVEPIEKLIEINANVDTEPKILPFEEAAKVLQACRSFAVKPCSCRVHGKYLGRDVSKYPIDVYLTTNTWADYVIERGIGRKIEMQDALQILKDCDKKGLVHSTNNCFKTSVICNCDPENCGVLAGFIRNRYLDTVVRSNFLPAIKAELCKKCEKCARLCPPKAIFHHYPHGQDLKDDFMVVREELCIGCGVCAANCAEGAIQLHKVRDVKVVEGITEMWQNLKANKVGIHELK